MRAPRRTLGPVAAVAVAASAYGLLMVGTAHAASCAQVSISPGVQAPTLSPQQATINAGGCVAYTNNTAFPVRVKVGKLSDVANPNGLVTFVERAPGTFAVTAQEQLQGQGFGGTGSGTLVVRKAPAPKPSPSSSPPRPSPSASHPAPSASPTSSGPVVASSPPTKPPASSPAVTPAPDQSGQGNPPVIGGIPTASPTPSQSEAVVQGQLQPPSGRATGLPAAIAALLVVGAAGAFVRVLLAEPAGAVPRAS